MSSKGDDVEDMEIDKGGAGAVRGPSRSLLGKREPREASETEGTEEDSKPPPSKKTSSSKKGSPIKKKPVCKYGPKCFQTSTKHKEQFDHPWVSW